MDIIVPESVREIRQGVFLDNQNMSVEIKEGIASIGKWNFSYGGSGEATYNTIILPSSLRHLDEYCFWGCEAKELYLKSTTPPSGRPSYGFGVTTIYVPMASVQDYLDDGWFVTGFEY